MALKRRGTKALAAGLPFGRLADRSPPAPEDGNQHQSRRLCRPYEQGSAAQAQGIKARRAETAKRVPFTRARPGALAQG